MSKLVAVKRLDKNNVLVTRYVLPENADKAKSMPAPSVSLSPQEQRKADSLECNKIKGLSNHSYLSTDIYAGKIRLSDVRDAGAGKLRYISGYLLRDVLQGLAAGTDKYTSKDINKIVSGDASRAESRIQLTLRFGTEFTNAITNHYQFAHSVGVKLDNKGGYSDSYIKSVILYSVDYCEEDNAKNGIYGILPKVDEFIVFHDARIPAQEVFEKGITVEQAQAVVDGKAASTLAEGWL